jgi:hypothetical protein
MEALSAERLVSVAALWKSTGRELVTSFQGVSMLPTIAPGQRVVLRCHADVRPGDIVAVVRGPELLVHRLVAASTSGQWFLLKGDANRFCDPPVTSPGAILGRIEGIERDGAFVEPPPPPLARQARLLTAGSAFLLRVHAPTGVRALGALTTARRLLLRTYARLRARPEGPSPPATPS